MEQTIFDCVCWFEVFPATPSLHPVTWQERAMLSLPRSSRGVTAALSSGEGRAARNKTNPQPSDPCQSPTQSPDCFPEKGLAENSQIQTTLVALECRCLEIAQGRVPDVCWRFLSCIDADQPSCADANLGASLKVAIPWHDFSRNAPGVG